jgi:hypothetical protein
MKQPPMFWKLLSVWTSMPAQIFEVVGRQFAQDLAIYRVIAEGRRVLFEPQLAQPRGYVHAVILSSEELQLYIA